MSFIGTISSLFFVAITAVLLLKKYNPPAILLFVGLLMLIVAQILNLNVPTSQNSTEFSGFYLFEYIKESFKKTFTGIGLMIMSIGGFVAYSDKIGASNALVYTAMKPLKLFKSSPYLLTSLVIPIGQVLFIAIPSATGLGLLLMASLFPILVNLGVSRLSAVSVITATTIFDVGPASAITAAASNIANLNTVVYFLNYQIPLIMPLSLCLMITYYFVNKYYDSTNNEEEREEVKEKKLGVPLIFAIIPVLPVLLLIIFSELFNAPVVLDTTTTMFVSLFVALLFEFFRTKNIKHVFNSLQTFWNGMSSIFKTVVILIITADVFAKGLINLGFIDGLLSITKNLGFGKIGIGITMTIMIFFASMLMGSGNASFFSFGPLVPKIAKSLGAESSSIILPMQLSSSIGRTASPVSGVLIATAGIAKVSPIEVVKRNLIPLGVTLTVMLIYHYINLPVSTS